MTAYLDARHARGTTDARWKDSIRWSDVLPHLPEGPRGAMLQGVLELLIDLDAFLHEHRRYGELGGGGEGARG